MSKVLKDQYYISKQHPLPVDDIGGSSSIQTAPSETVALYFNSSGTRTADASTGEAAGTAVTGQLAFKNILDAGGGMIATYNDTSLAFTGTCLTTEVAPPTAVIEKFKDAAWSTKLAQYTADLANGEYWVDYRSGTIYGVKKTTAWELTSVTYKINQEQTGGGSTLPSSVDVAKVGGTATVTGGVNGTLGVGGTTADGATDSGKPLGIGGLALAAQRAVVTTGQRVKAVFNLSGELVIAGYIWATGKIGVTESNPLSSQYLNNAVDVDTTNVSAATHYYPSATGACMDTKKGLSVTGKLIDADGTMTVTIEATNDEDTTSGDWEDVTATFIDTSDGAVGGSYTVTNGTLIFGLYNPDFNFRHYRIVEVSDGATNTLILKARTLY